MGTSHQCALQADEYVKIADSDLSTNDPGITYATLALWAELRALRLELDSWANLFFDRLAS